MKPVKCVHCGDDCGKYPVEWENKSFCCHGCKTVYQILSQKKLNRYYEIEPSPGIRVERHDFDSKYAYLDDEEVIKKILDFSEGDVCRVTLFIPTIHCSSCIWLLENLHTLDKGIKYSQVNFTRKEVTITFNKSEITLRQAVELLASVHYIPQITLDKVEGRKKPKPNTALLVRIGIAGFSFGNIMLISMPGYLSLDGQLEGHFRSFFGYVNILLSLPVLLYCGNGYIFSAIKSLARKIINIDLPITLGIFALAGQSYYEILSGTGTGYLDSFTGFIFFLLIGKWYQDKTYQSLAFDRDYKSYFPVSVTRIINHRETSVQLKELKPGDHILIHNQELIPADGIIVKGNGHIDYSFVTGESLPVNKSEGDPVFAGGKQIGSAIVVKVVKDVAQSRLTQLWNQEKNDSKTGSEMKFLIDRISRHFTIGVLAVAFITAIYWYIMDPSIVLMAFTSVLIVACPCAIALSMPFCFGTAMRIYGDKGFYLKNTGVLERLTSIDTVVFDKTGTITHHRSKNVALTLGNLSAEEAVAVKSLARQSAHPLSQAVFVFLETDHIDHVEGFMEIPSEGIKGTVDGMKVRMGSAEFAGYPGKPSMSYASEVYVSVDGIFKARFSVGSRYREGIEQVVAALLPTYELHVLSGDNDADRQSLKLLFGNDGKIHFNQSPDDKLRYIESLRHAGKNVLMIGDGLNDAGALGRSNVGISIADDIYQFSPACDAILESGKFSRLVTIIRFSKASLVIVKTSYLVSVIYNIIGLFFAVRGLLSPIIAAILMPASSISVVVFVTFTTRILAGSLLKDE